VEASRVPRSQRIATFILWSMVPIGIALIVIGLIELRWWNSPQTDRLFDLFAVVKADNGLARPALLRGPGGAWELVGLGAISLAYAGFVPYIRKGNRSARTIAMVAGAGLLLYTVVDIGGDAMFGTTIGSYLTQLGELKPVPGATAAEFLPLWPPAWYSWFEDIAQGAQAVAFLAAFIVLATVAIGQDERLLIVRDEPTDQYGKALRRFVDERRTADSE
jgi:hypothetical protein